MRSTKIALTFLACLSISISAITSEAKRAPLQTFQGSFKRQAPETYRYLSDPTNQRALVKGLRNALRKGGLSDASIGALSSSTRRIVNAVVRDMKDPRGQTATLVAPAMKKAIQILRSSGFTGAMRRSAERSKKYDKDPVLLKLNTKIKEIDSWPEAKRRALAKKITARVEADPFLKAAIESLQKARGSEETKVQLANQHAQVAKRVLAVARTTLEKDLGFSRAEVDRMGTIAGDVSAPLAKTLQIYVAPKDIYQKAARLALVTRIGLKGLWRVKLKALGDNLGARFDKEIDTLVRSVKEDPGKFDSKRAETALKADPAWKALEAAASADVKKLATQPQERSSRSREPAQ